ncbi:MAG: diaminopimelate decarboxylase [Acidimicrobiaceae bacterium]|nr:diaminopimelate decarboxylase [Acidimicrobiaceae bacterium]
MTPLPRHLLPLTAAIDEQTGRLRIGGLDLLDLAAEYGTPLFVYDEEHLRQRCREARQVWGDGVAYASKAFLCKAMAALAYEEGLHVDVSTGGELHVALSAGVPGERLVLHGNNKSESELQAAIEAGVGRIVVDSFDEIDRLERLGHRDQKLLIRVTPGVAAHTHEYVMTGQDDSKFGFGLASGQAAQAVERLRPGKPGKAAKAGKAGTLVGVHAHIGSQIFLLHSFVKEVEALAEFFTALELPELCVGGGLGVAYVEGEESPPMEQWSATVKRACHEHGIPTGTRITAEPGRTIAAAAAVTLYTVGTIKDLPGIRTYVSVDGGMSDNPRPVLYGSGYEAFLPRAANAERPRAATIVGKHCESGDVIVRDARLPIDLAVGDILATPVTGAYGHSMASNYNKVPRPAVIFVKDGEARAVVRRETLDDLLRNDL